MTPTTSCRIGSPAIAARVRSANTLSCGRFSPTPPSRCVEAKDSFPPKPTPALGTKRQTLSPSACRRPAAIFSAQFAGPRQRAGGSALLPSAGTAPKSLHWHNRPSSSDNRPRASRMHAANSSASAGSSPYLRRQSSMSDEHAVSHWLGAARGNKGPTGHMCGGYPG